MPSEIGELQLQLLDQQVLGTDRRTVTRILV